MTLVHPARAAKVITAHLAGELVDAIELQQALAYSAALCKREAELTDLTDAIKHADTFPAPDAWIANRQLIVLAANRVLGATP